MIEQNEKANKDMKKDLIVNEMRKSYVAVGRNSYIGLKSKI